MACLAYEPVGIDQSGSRIDLGFFDKEQSRLLEFKTTNPQSKEPRVPVEKFSADTLTTNPIYYGWISSVRSHLLEFLGDAEQKLRNYPKPNLAILGVYKNFYVKDFELEHLWDYYITGCPRVDDAFGDMMAYEVERKNFAYVGSIDELWAFPFGQYDFHFRDKGQLLRFKRP